MISEPEYSAASTTVNSERHSCNNPVPDRKILRRRRRAERKFRKNRAIFFHYIGEFAIFFRINEIQSAAENRIGDSRPQRAPMRSGIEPSRQSRVIGKSARSEILGQTLGAVQAVTGWPAGSNDCDLRQLRIPFLAAYIKDDRRIEDLPQQRRIGRIAECRRLSRQVLQRVPIPAPRAPPISAKAGHPQPPAELPALPVRRESSQILVPEP